jgi:L-aspartate oxidase
MLGVHDQAELAPRDVVAKAIMRTMRESGAPHVWLDGRHLGAELWSRRFPTILESCRSYGIDPVTALIPVSPACHYASGGVRTDLFGRTSVPGLYACGEVACTGVHGANRLASNSLLEGLVFAERIDADLAQGLPERQAPSRDQRPAGLLEPAVRGAIQATMTEGAGVLRSRNSLGVTGTQLRDLASAASSDPCTGAWETTNLHTVASFLVAAAALREETRGSHWREDFPDVDDAQWRGRLVGWLSDGRPEFRFEPITDEVVALRPGKEAP